MTLYWPYVLPMLFICTTTALLGLVHLPQMTRTSLAIAGNWAAGTAIVFATGVYDPWMWFILIDAGTASIILHHPAGRMQSALGWTYIAQIIFHGVYALSKPYISPLPYLEALTMVAYLQLILL